MTRNGLITLIASGATTLAAYAFQTVMARLMSTSDFGELSSIVATLNIAAIPIFGIGTAITRDVAIIVPEKLTHAEILRVIEEPAEPLLESVQLFDLFEGTEGTAPPAEGDEGRR